MLEKRRRRHERLLTAVLWLCQRPLPVLRAAALRHTQCAHRAQVAPEMLAGPHPDQPGLQTAPHPPPGAGSLRLRLPPSPTCHLSPRPGGPPQNSLRPEQPPPSSLSHLLPAALGPPCHHSVASTLKWGGPYPFLALETGLPLPASIPQACFHSTRVLRETLRTAECLCFRGTRLARPLPLA